MKRLLSLFWPKAPWVYVYMLQQFEYHPAKFVSWAFSFPDLFLAQKRGKLKLTSRVKLMLAIAYGSWAAVIGVGLILGFTVSYFWLLFILFAPAVSVVAIYVVSFVLQNLVIDPKQQAEIAKARAKLAQSSAKRIAVLGSYGKTSMKEILATILAEGQPTAATPGNKNVKISHARWVNKSLTGDEAFLIFEYGEGKPGDILDLASLSQPTHAIITGIAPAHLDEYPDMAAIAEDFASISQIVPADHLYCNHEAALLRDKVEAHFYDGTGLGDWKVDGAKVDFTGTRFTLTNGSRKLKLHSALLGRHHIGPLAAAAVLASQLGLTDEQITHGVGNTAPYEHRMQARAMHGAWIVDDTYNGNIEGMRAGLALMKELPGKRRIYVTPGLVDQGVENANVHKQLGRLIAEAKPDQVVLMKNSNTKHIEAGLQAGGFHGKLTIEPEPLLYYQNLEHYLAAGDVVMLQNDLPDSYH